jgi:TatD DNase family protein
MRYFDAHTHVNFRAFNSDYREVIERAREAGVGMVNVGTQRDTSSRAVELTREYGHLYAAVGLHPIHTSASYHDEQELSISINQPNQHQSAARGFMSRAEEFDYEYYKKLASDPKVVAIGECGLDYFRLGVDSKEEIERQKQAFRAQVELARELKKLLMIHARASAGTDDAYEDLLGILEKVGFPGKAIFHFYAGSPQMAEKLLTTSYGGETYFTFGGVITFVRDYDKVINLIPAERILSETDAPYVTPAPHRGKRNEPAYVVEVVRKLAEIKNIPEEEMRTQILKNTENVFGINLSSL